MFLNGTKTVEIRSWQTNYRGELLLHCASREADGSMAGRLIASCVLSKIEWNGETKMYEWHLEEIKPLSEKIRVKGKLGLWNYPS